ncbi:hypothetical protein HDF12_001799 [Edaphobacter lichenicola]|uniref:Uncharacterized protein n=2 Tax=Tunturiibacter TaxID=3154218 RepID=A0A7Y9T4J7_9BACT|nr:hypothetical protein [Edaphobacter lichenicola]
MRRVVSLHPMGTRYGMLARLAKGAGLAAVGLALIVGQGCKKKQAPVVVQPVVRTVPRAAQPDFPDDPPPVPVVADQRAHHAVRRMAPPVVQAPRPVVDPEALAEAQRQRDASLLQRQQAASQRQQQELNGVVQRSLKIQQDQQAEPRIQEAPQVPITQQPVPGQEGPRISDNPNVPPPQQQAEPEQPEQPGTNPSPEQPNQEQPQVPPQS